ncbi:MAG: hypothetical protein FGM22_10325 [Burkholderiaceae bacterium]|nr:hypothetical protein [Burkholderiaceae bacterium]
MNPNPHQARQSRIERKQAALEPIRTALDEAVATAMECLRDPDSSMRLRAAHAISQLAGSYVKIYEAVELEARIVAIESTSAEQAKRN